MRRHLLAWAAIPCLGVPLGFIPLGRLATLLRADPAPTFQPLGLQGQRLVADWRSAWMVGLTADPAIDQILAQYLAGLGQQGRDIPQQGIWIQAQDSVVAQHQGQAPLPAASLAKLATTLAALQRWPLDHRFDTWVGMQGTLEHGVLRGDLVVRGGGDPLFVWEEGIVLANHLQTLGIERVTGDLVIGDGFTMNFSEDPNTSAAQLQRVMHRDTWNSDIRTAYRRLDANTAQPSLTLSGRVRRLPASDLPANVTWLVRHQSLPLVAILKAMNIYSNNAMADQVAALLGGADGVTVAASAMADLPPGELSLMNGSGLGIDNQMSARAAVAMAVALQRELERQGYSVADVLPVAGEDVGTLVNRHLPATAVVKTGTLADVSALAGMVPTADQGPVWFAIINRGRNIATLRAQQDQVIQAIQAHWGIAPLPAAMTARVNLKTAEYRYGDPRRNIAP
ncbi:MAG: D-alanyl-D-alanine carboxypeptidase [Leptolyngbya sp.]|nr:D-alanyl-D-alanine carboxypeptidase [Leptolyngbya sp.]